MARYKLVENPFQPNNVSKTLLVPGINRKEKPYNISTFQHHKQTIA